MAAADDPIIVIQCAASKNRNAGFMRRGDRQMAMFVAKPSHAPRNDQYVYAHPDDDAGSGASWRDELWRYNARYAGSAANNPWGLLPAWKLYTESVYADLWRKYGPERLYILSAGWGLIRGDFLTPNYDITFSKKAEPYKRRGKRDAYQDWRMLPEDADNPVVFFGGQGYIGFFCSLTERVKGTRHIFYNSQNIPDAPGCRLVKYATRTKTNWHYEAADAFLQGEIGL